MGYYCTVPQCTSLAGKTKNVKFHRFPRDVTMADKWNIILKRGKPYTKYSKVCSLHFTQSDYNVTTMGQWKTLSKDAVPSQNLPRLNADGSLMVIRKSRTVKYRESRKDSTGEKCDKWSMSQSQVQIPNTSEPAGLDPQNSNIAYRLQTLSAIASALPPQMLGQPIPKQQVLSQPIAKPKKQDAIMQTDPVQSEEDDSQPDNSYNEPAVPNYDVDYMAQYKEKEYQYQKEKEYEFEKEKEYQLQKQKEYEFQKEKEYQLHKEAEKDYQEGDKKYETPKDYTKQDDYIPRTNEEYNKEAEKYALERKNHNGFEKPAIDYQKIQENGYKSAQGMYGFDKEYPRSDYIGYQYPDSADILRNQQHNIEMLQQQHRATENQNFFNENHIKQEIDMIEEDKYMFERAKDQIENTVMYGSHRTASQQQRLLEHLQQQVKQEPETAAESVMQPQGSPYYAPNGHNSSTGVFYEPLSRPGPELLIAKQNALAAHTQLWQNMKRPFFYSEAPHYSQLHRYEDLTRILQ